MEAKRLAGLEPASVFGYFEQICAIPHGSRNTKAISDFLVDFAREQGLRYIQDESNNVILFQEDRLVEGISALSNLLALGKGKEECLESLFLLGLEGQERKKVSELSGGMKRRVAIARVLLMDGDRFFLDEPFTGLDGETKEAVASVLKKKLKGKTVVVVSHSEEDGPLMGSDDIIYLGEKENGRKN